MRSREVEPRILVEFKLSGRWRWREPGERVEAEDLTDFETEPVAFRPVRSSEIGTVVLEGEDFDWMTPLVDVCCD